ncbi:hypothetical protein Tco_1032403 [Tanacetum coccineum]|uniref:DNA polymerase epsilon catalytic subunit n=1 Tax=Tanacetum coccineum TaxID=301880 RepID=A0ABQ5GE29_9ASTR
MKARYFSSPNFLRFTKSPLSPLSHSQTLATTKVALNLILTRNTYPLSHTTTATTTATTVAHHSSHNQASNRLIELGGGAATSDLLTCFKLDPSAFNVLIENLDRDLLYAIRVEGKMDIESVSNHDEVKNAIMERILTTAARPYGSTTTKAQNQDGWSKMGPVEMGRFGTEELIKEADVWNSEIAADGVDPRKQTFSFWYLSPPCLHATKASASKFLLSWLYQHEHEYENTGPNISRKERMFNNKRSRGLKAGLMIERDGD